MMQYNKGNLQKYHTKNPLKRFMINYFEQKLLNGCVFKFTKS